MELNMVENVYIMDAYRPDLLIVANQVLLTDEFLWTTI